LAQLILCCYQLGLSELHVFKSTQLKGCLSERFPNMVPNIWLTLYQSLSEKRHIIQISLETEWQNWMQSQRGSQTFFFKEG